MPQLCFSTAARLAAKLLFYIESSFLCILSYNANTPFDDVGRNVAKIVHHAMLAGHSRCADYALGFVLVGKDGVPDKVQAFMFYTSLRDL